MYYYSVNSKRANPPSPHFWGICHVFFAKVQIALSGARKLVQKPDQREKL